MTPQQAGWSVIGEEDSGPAPCLGSGQVPMFDDQKMVVCPVCGQRVAAVLPELSPEAVSYIVTHQPPPLAETDKAPRQAPTMALWG